MAGGRRNFNSNGKQQEEPKKVKITKESLKESLILFTYLKPYRTKFIFALVCIALSAFTTSLFPFLLGKMIDVAVPGSSFAMPGGTSFGGQFSDSLKYVHWSLNTIILFIFF